MNNFPRRNRLPIIISAMLLLSALAFAMPSGIGQMFTPKGDPPITLSPESGQSGTLVVVNGASFTDDVNCTIQSQPNIVHDMNCVVGSTGTLLGTFNATGPPGAYMIVVYGNFSSPLSYKHIGYAPFNIVPVSTTTVISTVTSTVNGGTTTTTQTSTSTSTSITGTTMTTTSTATSWNTTHATTTQTSTVTLTTSSTTYVGPRIVLSTTSGHSGTTVLVTGSSFHASDTICTVSSVPLGIVGSGTCSVPTAGSLSVQFIAPASSGAYTITVTGSPMGDSASAVFVVTPSPLPTLTLTPTYGPTTVSVTVTGTNFQPTATSCTISSNPTGLFSSTPSCSISSGTLTGTLVVSASAYTQVYIVSAQSNLGSLDSASAPFTVFPGSVTTVTATSTVTQFSYTYEPTTVTQTQTSITHVTETGTSTKIVSTITQSQTTTSIQTIPVTVTGTTTIMQTNLQVTTAGTELSTSTTITTPPLGLPTWEAALIAVGIAVAAIVSAALLFRRRKRKVGELPEKPSGEVLAEEGKPPLEEEVISPEPTNRICPQCLHANVPSAVWCANCHQDIASVPVTPATAAPPAGSIKCSHCGQQNAANTEFCTECGENFPKPTATQAPSTPVVQVCQKCQTPRVSPQALFCKRCGTQYPPEPQGESGTTTEEDEHDIQIVRDAEEQAEQPQGASKDSESRTSD